MAGSESGVEPDRRLRLARLLTLLSLSTVVLASLVLPGIGLFFAAGPGLVVVGTVGILAFTAGQAGALYGVVTPWLARPIQNRLTWSFVVCAVVSVPLVGPVGTDRWPTWLWLGASVLGTLPLLVRRWDVGAGVVVATLVAAVLVAVWTGADPVLHLWLTAAIGAGLAAVNVLPVLLWDLLMQAQAGRAAQARLAVTEERLRFARDLHDLLGHSLSVIALKAELAERLAPIDAERAGLEAAEARQVAATALTDMREAVHGYRAVDLRDQVTAVEQVLRSSGVRCTVTQPTDPLPADAAGQLVPVLREASTNVLRHSRATWCTIEIRQDGEEVRMTVVNDGAAGAEPDRHSFGLRGLADRLAYAGGALRTSSRDGVFTLEATVRRAT
ncbi:histidine kinase [Micromonospora sp. WMMD1082]|uniref:sensor histidine kinase n=1 Tax=Micromonospora sp. WMMD1082 TaxID=3016104 RepID=UPI0024169A9B|nr:histidine kinase [Micromonospora sp. WMMD1082]MDG4794560.1 histidine kinase [Micromonospora sp. WMMD1082]